MFLQSILYIGGNTLMRNDILFAKRVIGIAACSSLSRKSWDDLCSKVIEPSLSKISKDKGLVVINGKSYQIEDISDNVAEELIMEVEGNEAKDFLLRTCYYSSLSKKYKELLQAPPLVDYMAVVKRILEGEAIEKEVSNHLVPAAAFVEIAEDFEGKVDSNLIAELLHVALKINAELASIITSISSIVSGSTLALGKRAQAIKDRFSMLSEEEPSTNLDLSNNVSAVAVSEPEPKPVDEAMTPIESAEEPVAAEETTDIASNDQGLKETMNNEDEGFKFVGDTSSIKPEDTTSANPSPEYPRKEDMGGGDGAGGADESGDGGDETSDDDDAKSDEDADSSFD